MTYFLLQNRIRRAQNSSTILPMPMLLVTVTALITLALIGCSAIESDQTPIDSTKVNVVQGLPYRLPMGLIHAEGTGNETNYAVTLSVIFRADPTTPEYYARRVADYSSDDSFFSQISSTNELLTTLSATNADRTADIITSLGQIALQAAALPAPATNTAPTILRPFSVTFEPDDSDQVATAKSRIADASGLIMKVNEVGQVTTNAPPPPLEQDGLLYRPLTAWKVTFNGSLNGSVQTRYDTLDYISVPNKRLLYSISYTRVPFVTKTTTVSFFNGVPVSFSENVPSPIYGFLNIPANIIKGILPFVGSGASATQGVAKTTTTPSK